MTTIQKISFVTLLVAMLFIAAFSVASFASAQTTGGGGTGCSGCGGDGGGTTGGGTTTGGGGGGGGSNPVPPVCNISLSASTIDVGGQFTLTWNGSPSNATFQINNTEVADSGSANYTFPAGLSSIRYVMTGQNGTATCMKEVVITRTTPPAAPTCDITVNVSAVTVGGRYTITWAGTPTNGIFKINGAGVAATGNATYTFVGPNTETFTFTGETTGGTCSDKVTVTRVNPVLPTCTLNANPTSIVNGGSSVLSWTTTNASSTLIDQGIGVVTGTSRTVNPTVTTTYTMTVTNPNGSATCTRTVTVTRVNPVLPTCTLNANPTSIVNGGSSVLSWTTTNASSTLIDQGIGVVTGTSRTVNPTVTTTYTMTVTNPNGSATCTRTVTVTPVVPTAPRCDNFDAAPLTINRGQSSVLSWNTTNATAAMINNGVGAVAVDGSTSVSPLETTTYTLSLTGVNNQTASCTRTITVIQPNDNAPRCESFNASATTITRGNSVTLSWDTTNATAVVINPGVGSVSVDGSTSVSPSETTTYTLTATGANNQTTSCTRTINVESGSNGGGGGGSSSPKCTLKISDTKISRGDRITLKWDTSRATDVTLKDSHGKTLVTTDGKKSADKKDLYDGEITLRPEKDTTYTLLAERGSKDRTCKVSVDVKDGVTVIEDRDQKPVVTGIALTQVPYTGFEAGPFLTMVFYGLLLLWALYLAYVLVVRRKEGGLAFATATAAPAPVAPQAVEATSIVASTLATPRFVAQSPVAPVATPVVGYGTAETTDAAYEAVANTVEDAAHAARVLISSEAMRHFVAATTDENRTETLTAVLAKAKASYPAEDGWVVLNIDRMKSVTAAIAPVVSVFTPKSVTE